MLLSRHVGEKVIVRKRAEKKRKDAVVLVDFQEMIIIQYLKTGIRESFIKPDFVDGTVKFFN